MRTRICLLLLAIQTLAPAVIIDRIAVVIGNSIIKDSDIERDIRVTSFLNNRPVDLSAASRKKAVERLIGQVFIRREIRIGDYPTATLEEADQQLDKLKKQRFKTNAAFEEAVRRYGLTDLELRTQFQWQLTVLKFIDVRFRPAVFITDTDIDKYYRQHRAELERAYPGESLDDLRDRIREILTGENINREFFSWLDDQRKNNKIEFREGSLA